MKADRDESSPYAAMLAAQDVSTRCKVFIFFNLVNLSCMCVAFVSCSDCLMPFYVVLP